MVIAALYSGSIQPMSTGHITQGGGYPARGPPGGPWRRGRLLSRRRPRS